MRTHVIKIISLLSFAALSLGQEGRVAQAEIEATLESPAGYASQVSNVQGWAYTTTPGAELIQPFDVKINGVIVQQVPCCSDRGDVKDGDPSIPLRTGFSGVINWAREALDADGSVVLEVVVRDTAGDELILEETLDLYALADFPFSRSVAFAEVDGAAAGGVIEVTAPLPEHMRATWRFLGFDEEGEDDHWAGFAG